jgi:hypothetical protein
VVLFAAAFRRASLAQDRAARGLRDHRASIAWAPAFIVVFALTITLAAYDWLAALDPGWSEHDVRGLIFAGSFAQGIAAITLATTRSACGADRCTAGRGHPAARPGQAAVRVLDLWTYIWVCQYLLIWYGNIPRRSRHYVDATRGRWLPLFVPTS